ncbi:uncharacterized protein LOC125042674 [Penaeus chinensis]|uniref:uncharacterized protein LOC125042674 n=1 Tax=Penaeus chinensis TaxID=139456 RepID=UPI001FB81A07|nr:uncharacterized protein LOC125042674 [Penaeus chinensis]
MIHMCVWVERLAVCPDPMVEQFRAALGEVIRMCPLVMKHLDSPSPHDHMERGSSPLHPSPPTPPNLQRMWVENEQGSARDATPPRQPPAALDGQGSCGLSKGSGTFEVPGGDQRAGNQTWSPLTPDRTDVNLTNESPCSNGSAQRPLSSTPELYFSPMQKQCRTAANTTSDSSQCTFKDSSQCTSKDTHDKFFSPQAEKDSTSSLLSGKDFPSNSSFNSPTLMFKFADSSEFAGLSGSPGKSSQDDRDDENDSLFQFPKTKKSRRARKKRAGVRTASTPPRKTLQELKGSNCARPNKRTRADDLEGDEVTRLLLASIQNLGQPSRYVALESLEEV